MKIIYIAGAFRGDVEGNVQRAQDVGDHLAMAGVAFICPHSNGVPHDYLGLPDEYWLESTLEIQRRCDAVQLVSGWEDSSGTLGEILSVKQQNKPVFEPHEISECIAWAKSGE